MRKRKWLLRTVAVLCAVSLVVSLFFAGFVSGKMWAFEKVDEVLGSPEGAEQVLKLFAVYRIVKEHYVGGSSVSIKNVGDWAAKGLVEGLGDPYSRFLTEEEWRDEMERLKSEYVGVGILVTANKNGGLLILNVFENSPAEKGGLKKGDVITEVDGKSILKVSLDEAVDMIKGPPDTTVELKVVGVDGERKVKLRRKKIHYPTVEWKVMEVNSRKVGYLKVYIFGTTTPDEVVKAVKALRKKDVSSLVVDLRDNPGGLLSSAVAVADVFLKKGVITKLYTVDDGTRTFVAHSGGVGEDLPLVVLVNSYSASGSEVFTGAIKDNGRGVVVGTKTFGKGCVQTDYRLPTGETVRLTIGFYMTPSGQNINGVGIEPDVRVNFADLLETPEFRDLKEEKEKISAEIGDYTRRASERELKYMIEKGVEKIEEVRISGPSS